jgi:hypothetical protein
MGQFTNSEGYALNTVAALGADISTTNDGRIILTGGFEFKYSDIKKSQRNVVITRYIAPVARVTELTFTGPAAVGTSYIINLEQVFPGGGYTQLSPIVFNSVAGDTNATVAQRAKDVIDGLITAGRILGTTGIASNVLTLTGTTAAPMLRVVSVSGNISPNVTTGGNPAVNTGAQLAAYDLENLVLTNNYATITIPVASNNLAATEDGTFYEFIYAANEGSANIASFISKATDIFSGYIGNDSPNLNPGFLSLL